MKEGDGDGGGVMLRENHMDHMDAIQERVGGGKDGEDEGDRDHQMKGFKARESLTNLHFEALDGQMAISCSLQVP